MLSLATKYMATWNPVSVIIVGTFLLACFCIVWYVVTGMTPAPWIVTLGTLALGGGTYGMGGLVSTLHSAQLIEQTTANVVRLQNGKNGGPPTQ